MYCYIPLFVMGDLCDGEPPPNKRWMMMMMMMMMITYFKTNPTSGCYMK